MQNEVIFNECQKKWFSYNVVVQNEYLCYHYASVNVICMQICITYSGFAYFEPVYESENVFSLHQIIYLHVWEYLTYVLNFCT
jgi:hypothetical protein